MAEKSKPKIKDKDELLQKQISEMWKERENARSYLESIGLLDDLKRCRKFYLGEHWGKVTERTKHMPRPVFNICKKNTDHKVSNILSTPVKINFLAEDDGISTNKMTKFYNYEAKRMRLEGLDEEGLTESGIGGTLIRHYYWDKNVSGRKGNYEGGVRAQNIDVSNFYVANPLEKDIQKQRWVMLEDRWDIEAVKEIADKDYVNEIEEDIVEDKTDSIYGDTEQEGEKLCTVLTKYFRKDGEVYYQRATKNCILHAPICCNPKVTAAELEEEDFEIDAQETSAPNKPTKDNNLDDIDRFRITRYPFAIEKWDYNGQSIYGKGEIATLIETQKCINKEIGIKLYSSQISGWSKVLAKQGALRGQEITDEPGQVIFDYSTGNGWGITRFEGQNVGAASVDLAANIIELARNTTNASDVITGDMLSRDLSGTAIAQMQAQAAKPIERLKKNFWRFKEDEAHVLLQFFIAYYDEKEFTYELSYDEKKGLELQYQEQQIPYESISKYNVDTFRGEEYAQKHFDIQVEAGAGTQYSEIMAIDVLNNLFLGGAINNLDSEKLEQYIALAPDSYMPFKSEMKEIVAKQQQTELSQYKQGVEQMSQQIQLLQEQLQAKEQAIAQLNTNIEKAIGQNKALQNEYSSKINTMKKAFTKLQQEAIKNVNQTSKVPSASGNTNNNIAQQNG